VTQSSPDSSIVDTSVNVEKQATEESPAVLSVSYHYTGTETHKNTSWGEPYPFTESFATDSEMVLVPPEGFLAEPYSKPREDINVDQEEWVPEDESLVLLDSNDRYCWRIQDNQFAPDGAPLVDLTSDTFLTQFYWVVSSWNLPSTCASLDQYSHTMEDVPPTNEDWTISVELSRED
jgi:hypothetical protein